MVIRHFYLIKTWTRLYLNIYEATGLHALKVSIYSFTVDGMISFLEFLSQFMGNNSPSFLKMVLVSSKQNWAAQSLMWLHTEYNHTGLKNCKTWENLRQNFVFSYELLKIQAARILDVERGIAYLTPYFERPELNRAKDGV